MRTRDEYYQALRQLEEMLQRVDDDSRAASRFRDTSIGAGPG